MKKQQERREKLEKDLLLVKTKNQAAINQQQEREQITKEVHALLQVQANDFVQQQIEIERKRL